MRVNLTYYINIVVISMNYEKNLKTYNKKKKTYAHVGDKTNADRETKKKIIRFNYFVFFLYLF